MVGPNYCAVARQSFLFVEHIFSAIFLFCFGSSTPDSHPLRPIPCIGILADHRATTPWRPALMTRGQNHHPQAAGLSLCSFRFYPRGFTKMEARKAAGSMTRVTDDWTQLASGFPFLLGLFRSDPVNTKKMSY